MYEVIHFFTDLKDFNYPYHAGDPYPRTGMVVSAERLEELLSSKNRQNKPLIRLVEQKDGSKEVKYTKTEIARMTTNALREVAQSIGIFDAESMTGTVLKKLLVEKFGL